MIDNKAIIRIAHATFTAPRAGERFAISRSRFGGVSLQTRTRFNGRGKPMLSGVIQTRRSVSMGGKKVWVPEGLAAGGGPRQEFSEEVFRYFLSVERRRSERKEI